MALTAIPVLSVADECTARYEALSTQHGQLNLAVNDRSAEAFVRDMVALESAVFAAMQGCHNDARLLALMSELQLDLGQIPLATLYARKAVAADPGWWLAHHVLGVALSLGGQPAQGIEALRRAARMAPDNPRVRLNLASALIRSERMDEALPLIEQLTRADCRRTAAAAYFLRGRWRLEQGKLPQARADFVEAQRLGFSVERDLLPVEEAAPPLSGPGGISPAR